MTGKTFEELKAAAEPMTRRRKFALSPEEQKLRNRQSMKARGRAVAMLTHVHQDEYRVLFDGFLAEIRAEDGNA